MGGAGAHGVPLNIELVQRQLVHEGPHQVVGGEVEDQAEKDGDGQSGQRLLEDGEEQQGQTEALQEGRGGTHQTKHSERLQTDAR